jgi:hypothetical protein
MSTQSVPKRPAIQLKALRGLAAMIMFLVITALIEYVILLYAIGHGVTDATYLQWIFQFPGTNWPVAIGISPLFHLVPIAVVVALAFNWLYLTRKMATMPRETRKGREAHARRPTELHKRSKTARVVNRLLGRMKTRLHIGGNAESALLVLAVFLLFAVVVTFLAYPQLIYRTTDSAYQDNSSLFNFVVSVSNSAKGFADAVPPIGWISTAINNALLAVSPSIRGMGVSLGNLLKPVADLDSTGKYLVFQNAAAWISALIVLFYGEYWRKSPRYRRR